MNKLSTLLLALVLTFGAFQASAQTKIGYTNVEFILAKMPETKDINQQLQVYQQKLQDRLSIKEQYAQSKLQEYQEMKQTNQLNSEMDQAKIQELMGLEEEIKQEAQKAERQLMAKEGELLKPVVKKLQDAIDEVAAEKGYTYILNQTMGAGVSTILYGPEEHDITIAVMKKLGIPTENVDTTAGQ